MRAVVIVLDSVGIGGAPDAGAYGDAGADTLGHLLERDPGLAGRLPTLWGLGMGQVVGRAPVDRPGGLFGCMREVSAGKDSTTGHWELAGAVVAEPFGVFQRFPDELVEGIEREAGVRFLGNRAASGTAIIEELGPEHLRSGRPILYTSADSVLQIAAHEAVIEPDRLYSLCQVARRWADAYRIGRVIARPFVGRSGAFVRTAGRHDFSLAPPATVLEAIAGSGRAVVGVGKISDLFAGRGITQSYPTGSNAEGMERIEALWTGMGEGLLLANLVDFDVLYGHRRDPAGYAAALEAFDGWLARFLPKVSEEDLLVITADHGNDPTFGGTDHTRELVPLLVRQGGRTGALGRRETFADVAATLGEAFGLGAWGCGRSWEGD